jgi:GNAT superfamily N-acetyltransferase
MIRPCNDHDFELIWTVINEGAGAYKGAIPEDRGNTCSMKSARAWCFWGYEHTSELTGVMGIQDLGEVTLIRHAYVRTSSQRQGIGEQLLFHLRKLAKSPLLIGTWADAAWAIRFYEKHGFQMVSSVQKDRLLRKYWSIPERQAETSVVLASPEWLQLSR